jgi:hypothetical protein
MESTALFSFRIPNSAFRVSPKPPRPPKRIAQRVPELKPPAAFLELVADICDPLLQAALIVAAASHAKVAALRERLPTANAMQRRFEGRHQYLQSVLRVVRRMLCLDGEKVRRLSARISAFFAVSRRINSPIRVDTRGSGEQFTREPTNSWPRQHFGAKTWWR